ncbi:MAG TPA: restriction endonuclease [Edaphocola sp.]|nr:restriction endonuclease [Edaphocola sp.]
MGITKFLKSGRIVVNTFDKQIVISDSGMTMPYESISISEWGLVYEKYVGQVLEEEGYDVTYNGLNKGFLDRGVDLIAHKENQIHFMQCKFTRGNISKSRIDWILYKASRILLDTYTKEKKKLFFTLIVSNKEECFSKHIPKNFKLNFTETSKIDYPMIQYFLDHNHIQNKIVLEFREIEMKR